MYKINLLALFLTFASMLNAQDLGFKDLDSDEFNSKINTKKGTLLDVRTSSEYANGHLLNAGQLNYYALDFKKKLLLLPKGQPIYLYCNTGYRSTQAAKILVKNGFTEVYNLEKGIMDWNLNNLPVIEEENAQRNEENKMEPDEFYALIQSSQTVLIDFYAPWCGPCRKMMPLIDQLKQDYKDQLTVVKINADASKKLVKELQLGSVPYLVSYNSGSKVFDHFGLIEKLELIRKLEL